MMNKLTPLVKGIITGSIMVALSVWLTYTDAPAGLGLLLYGIYAGGIFWAVWDYYRSAEYSGRFADLFGQGFRCFIIVVLMMVAFTFIYHRMHPELAQGYVVEKRKELEKDKDKTPAQRDEMAATFEKQVTTSIISTTIFGYLIIGAVFTLAAAGLLLLVTLIRRN